jgi:hypothetical protein
MPESRTRSVTRSKENNPSMAANDKDREFYVKTLELERAIGSLVAYPREVTGACLRGASSTAIDMIASAEDDVLEEVRGCARSDLLKALRFMCRAFLALRRADR